MNTPMPRTALTRLAATAVTALALLAGTARADAPPSPSSAAVTPAFGATWFSAYCDGFIEHWGGVFKKQNGVIMAALGLGVVSLFIITRGKWKK
jgi:hypothetical protein